MLAGSGLLKKAGKFLRKLGINGKVLIVTQPPIARHYLKDLEKSIRSQHIQAVTHLAEDGETAKNQTELFRIFHKLCHEGFERRDAVIALGGGVVGDLAGFAASAYLRGLPFVNIPTTLLAQVDSSLGGKTAINLPQGKNLVGAFYPPKIVLADVQTLATISNRELYASLAEVVKYGVIRDAKLFDFLEKNAEKILQKHPASLEKIVTASAAIKAGVVSRDEFETKGERVILNFGHTFGHGFEKALDYRKLLHGEAVSVGMVCAADLAVRLKMFREEDFRRLRDLLKKFRLPVSLSGLTVDLKETLSAMSRDKKKAAGRLRFVLPVKIGKVAVRENISASLIQKILFDYGVKA